MDNPARITRAACHGMQVATQPRGPAIRACEWRVHVMLPAIPGSEKKSLAGCHERLAAGCDERMSCCTTGLHRKLFRCDS